MQRHGFGIALLIAAAASAPASAEVFHFLQHNANLAEGTHYRFTSIATVQILQGVLGQTFQFECYATDELGRYVGPRTIDSIQVAPTAQYVSVAVLPYQHGATYGAADIAFINLDNTERDCQIAALRISGDLGAGGDCALGTIAGPTTVEGRVLNVTHVAMVSAGATLTVGSVPGALHVGSEAG